MMLRAIETATGMALVFLLACVFVSSLNEWIALKRGRRGIFLDRGVKRLVMEDAIYRRILHHPLISALYRDRLSTGRPPAYIEPGSFALALVDVIHARAFAITGKPPPVAPLDHQTLRQAIVELRPAYPRLAQSLLPILDRAGDSYPRTLRGIEEWFAASMDRVSDWYQAHTRNILFGLGLLLAIVADVDSIALARSFWNSPEQRSALSRMADAALVAYAPDAPRDRSMRAPVVDLIEIERTGAPLGVACLDAQFSGRRLIAECSRSWVERFKADPLRKVLGWLFTALAISLGAPFWYQVLSRIVSMRAAGPKPAPITGTGD